jgi:hypothetical protein
MNSLFAAILPLVGVVLGVVFGHFFTAHRSRHDELAGFRLKAYSDFIAAASQLVAARRMGRTADEIDELAKLNDAKTRICICAEAPVVEALDEFWKNGGTLEREQEIIAFTHLCLRIRESLGNDRHDIARLNISETLFKLQPSTHSYKESRSSDANNKLK